MPQTTHLLGRSWLHAIPGARRLPRGEIFFKTPGEPRGEERIRANQTLSFRPTEHDNMADKSDSGNTAVADEQAVADWQPSSSKIVRFYSHPWTQILLISFICFCLPGVSCHFISMVSLH